MNNFTRQQREKRINAVHLFDARWILAGVIIAAILPLVPQDYGLFSSQKEEPTDIVIGKGRRDARNPESQPKKKSEDNIHDSSFYAK